MTHSDFLKLILDSPLLYITCLFVSLLLFIPLIISFTHSWIDPFRYVMITSAISNSAPLFLYIENNITSHFFYYFISSEICFWLGFILLARKKIPLSQAKVNNDWYIISVIFYLSVFSYILLTIISYIFVGIPLFSDSRIGTFQGSGGLGFIARINPYFNIFILFYIFNYISINKKIGYKNLIILSIIFIFVILSGSRAGLLGIIFCYFGYYFFYKKIIVKVKIIYFLIPLFGSILVFLINGSTLVDSFLDLLIRIVANGDPYYMAFPNEVIDRIDVGDKVNYILVQFGGPLRIIDVSNIPPPIGVQLANLIYPELNGLFVGPNSRPVIMGYALMGFNGYIFTFFMGLITSFIIYQIPKYLSNNFINSTLIFYLYFVAIRFVGDPSYGFASLFDVLVTLFFITFYLFIAKFIKSDCTIKC